MQKIIYLDTETGGLNSKVNPILSISGLIYTDQGNESFDIHMKPPETYTIEQSALDVNNMTLEDINHQQSYEEAYCQFVAILDKYIDKYNKDDKFVAIVYNGKFDFTFLEDFFAYFNNSYFYSYFTHHYVDVYELAKHINYNYNLPVENLRLTTLCEYYHIDHNAHTSLGDVIATCNLYNLLRQQFLKGF